MKATSRHPRAIRSRGRKLISTTRPRCSRSSSGSSTSATGAGAASACAIPFPTLFDAVDASPTGELDGVPKAAYWQVVDHCYLCDMCYMTKCPYVPPHPWNVDFPHLMLRAKAVKFERGQTSLRDKVLSSTDQVGSLAGIPVVSPSSTPRTARAPDVCCSNMHSACTAMRRCRSITAIHSAAGVTAREACHHAGRDRGDPRAGRAVHDLLLQSQRTWNRCGPGGRVRTQRHPVTLTGQEKCCGMPKLELGDLKGDRAPQGRQRAGARCASSTPASTWPPCPPAC
jgi:glycerol-3-phosphate dehydrogenase subunit C